MFPDWNRIICMIETVFYSSNSYYGRLHQRPLHDISLTAVSHHLDCWIPSFWRLHLIRWDDRLPWQSSTPFKSVIKVARVLHLALIHLIHLIQHTTLTTHGSGGNRRRERKGLSFIAAPRSPRNQFVLPQDVSAIVEKKIEEIKFILPQKESTSVSREGLHRRLTFVFTAKQRRSARQRKKRSTRVTRG